LLTNARIILKTIPYAQKHNLCYIILFLGILFWVNNSFANDVYKRSKFYYLKKEEHVDLKVKYFKGFQMNSQISEIKHYNEAVPAGMRTDYIYCNSFSEVDDIKAEVRNAHESNPDKYKTNTHENIERKTYLEKSTLYDDGFYYEINHPKIRPGGETAISYTELTTDPHFVMGYYFSERVPVKKAVYSILLHKDIQIHWEIMGDQKDQVKFSEEEKGKNMLYTWVLDDAAAIPYERSAPGFLHMATHLLVFVDSYTHRKEDHPVLKSKEDLFTWYQGFIASIDPKDDQKLTALTNEIIGDAEGEQEKAQLIYKWIQKNIRYVAVEDGWRGFIPYPANDICEKRYGDCKDMTHLMVSMMKIAGLNATHAWVGTRDRPYTYDQVPSPIVDNHQVVCLTIDDQIYVLDATNSKSVFGMPTDFILSKEMLFAGANGEPVIYRIPSYSPDDCVIRNDIELSINGEMIEGKCKKRLETFAHSDYLYFKDIYGEKDPLKISEYLKMGQGKFELYTWSDTIDNEDRSQIDYTFQLTNQLSVFDSVSFINLNLSHPYSNKLLKKDRKQAFEIDYKRRFSDKIVLKIPKNYSVIEIPDATSFENEMGSLSANYRVEGERLIYERDIQINTLLVQPDQFQEWNDLVNQLTRLYSTAVYLEIKNQL
jgi:transglutaminase-like putative cysteine protease